MSDHATIAMEATRVGAPSTLAPVAHLSRRYRFSASHRLHVSALDEERNRTLFGKCNNPFGHGHNYFVQVTLAGPIDPETGMVVNLGDLDAFAARELLACFDLANLNEHPRFQTAVPSTENLCVLLWEIFARFPGEYRSARLLRLRIEETGNNAFDYFGEGEPVSSLAEA